MKRFPKTSYILYYYYLTIPDIQYFKQKISEQKNKISHLSAHIHHLPM